MMHTLSSLPLPLSLLALLSLLSSVHGLVTPNVPPTSIPGQSIPVVRRSRTQSTPDELASWAQRNKAAVEVKYGGRSALDKRASGTNLITDLQYDSSYFGSIAVGTPPVSYNVILDTGSSDLWLATSSSFSTVKTSSSSDIATYNPSSSSSSKETNTTFEIQYGSGAAKGVLGSDTVQFAGFQVASQVFGLVSETSSSLLSSPLSGLMGLAFQSIASSGATPFWQILTETTGTLDSPVMAFQLMRFTNNTSAQPLEPGGTFTIGAVNETLFTGGIDYQDIPSGAPGYWILELASINVQGTSITPPSGSGSWAAIDTGTTGIAGPSSVLSEIYAAIPGSAQGTGQYSGYYTFPCSTDVTVTLTFGSSNISWPIAATDFALQQVSADLCIGAMFALNSSGSTPSWIIGDSFLKNVYSVFRASSPASVGFASLSSAAIAMNSDDTTVPTPTIGSVSSAVTATGAGVSSVTPDRSSSDGGERIVKLISTELVLSVLVCITVGLFGSW